MARLPDVWFTPGELKKRLKFGRSGVQKILKKFEEEELVERWQSPAVSYPPSIASLPPPYATGSAKRRTVSSRQGEKPYRISSKGERMCELVETIEQIGLPTGLQKNPLTGDAVFMGKLKGVGFDEHDIEKAEKAGVLDHHRRKIQQETHETTFGVITQDAIAKSLQPQPKKTRTVILHRYRIA